MPNPSTLLEGNLGYISLPNLMQLIALEQKDALLVLNRIEIGQSAEMVFQRGVLVSARVNQIEGDLAMLRIIGWWNAGTFKLVELQPEEMPERNVQYRMDYLLLEGMRQMDATSQVRSLVPQLTSAVSFTQAALDSFRWDQTEPAEWIPWPIRQLPRSFSMAQLHQVTDMDEVRLAGLLKMLLATQAVRVHSGDYEENGFDESLKNTRYEAFAQLLMEYVGYEQAYSLLDGALYDLGWDDLDSASFTQLLDLCDRLGSSISQQADRRKAIEAQRRLRARATSLIG